MEDYRSNSNKSKAMATPEPKEERRVEAAVSTSVKVKKKSGFRKLSELMIQEDAENIKSYIILDVLIPSLKKAISDVVTNGVDMLLYGGTRKNKSYGGSASRVSYRSFYEDRREEPRRSYARPVYDFDEIYIPNRAEAEEVLIRMNELIDTYGSARVADFYDLVGISGSYTDNRYGWTSISTAHVVRDRDGYVVKLPRPVALD